jgi:hypothetical protein
MVGLEDGEVVRGEAMWNAHASACRPKRRARDAQYGRRRETETPRETRSLEIGEENGTGNLSTLSRVAGMPVGPKPGGVRGGPDAAPAPLSDLARAQARICRA